MSKIDWNKPLVTRNGRKARRVCSDRQSDTDAYPCLVLVLDESGKNETAFTYTTDGKFFADDRDNPAEMDLLNVPEKFSGTVWLNIYPEGTGTWNTREQADRMSNETRVACIPMHYTVTRGEGLHQ